MIYTLNLVFDFKEIRGEKDTEKPDLLNKILLKSNTL